jgi:hypothetical protein
MLARACASIFAICPLAASKYLAQWIDPRARDFRAQSKIGHVGKLCASASRLLR